MRLLATSFCIASIFTLVSAIQSMKVSLTSSGFNLFFDFSRLGENQEQRAEGVGRSDLSSGQQEVHSPANY